MKIPLKEAARIAGMSERTARRYVHDRGIPHTRGEKDSILVDPDDLIACREKVREEQRDRMRTTAKLILSAPVTTEEERTVAEDDKSESSSSSDDEPLVEQKDEDDVEVPSADDEEHRPPRRRLRPRGVRREEKVERAPLITSELPDDLRRLVQLSTVLRKHAVSVTIVRLPRSPEEAALFGANGVSGLVGVPGDEFRAAVARGGVPVLAMEKIGPGRARVLVNGPLGTVLHEMEVEVPDFAADARVLQDQQRERERLQADERQLAKEEQERDRARFERYLAQQRLQADHRAWARDCADLGVREASRRVNSMLGCLRSIAALRVQNFLAVVEHARLAAALKENVDLEVLERLDAAPDPQRAELEQWRTYDLEALRGRLITFLLSRADRLFPAPPWAPAVVAELDALIPPALVGGFMPWAELYRPPPPPPIQFMAPPPPPHQTVVPRRAPASRSTPAASGPRTRPRPPRPGSASRSPLTTRPAAG